MAVIVRAVLAGLFAIAVSLAAPGASAEGNRAELRLAFTSQSPGMSTGIRVDVRLGSPVGSAQKPPRLTGAVLSLPRGTVITTDVLPECTASDQELQAAGSLACPSGSQVGSGTIAADTGFGAPADPLVGDDTVINGDGELIELVTAPGTPAPALGIDHLRIAGNTLTAHPPFTPGGPPDGSTNIRRIAFVVPAHGSGPERYITTPARCPTSGRWVTTATFTFSDGGTTRTTAATPCHPAA